MTDNLNQYEIEVLEMLDGRREKVWGSWVGACLDYLKEGGYVTPMPYQLTDKGRAALPAKEP